MAQMVIVTASQSQAAQQTLAYLDLIPVTGEDKNFRGRGHRDQVNIIIISRTALFEPQPSLEDSADLSIPS
jgi:hypothetical protein